jgi:transcription initiation factor TFIID TATA-box-binding protein
MNATAYEETKGSNVLRWNDEVTGAYTTITIVNMVYTCSIETKLQLNHVWKCLLDFGAQYNRKRFSAVIIRYRNPKIALLLFAQGKIVCTGSKTREQARVMIYEIVETLRQRGYANAVVRTGTDDRNRGLTIQNMVAAVILPWLIDVRSLSTAHSNCCNYEPELFPGAIIRRQDELGNITVLAFKTGKMVITGAKSSLDVMNAMDSVMKLIRPFSTDRITGEPAVPGVPKKLRDQSVQFKVLGIEKRGREQEGARVVKVEEEEQPLSPRNKKARSSEISAVLEVSPKAKPLSMPRLDNLAQFFKRDK